MFSRNQKTRRISREKVCFDLVLMEEEMNTTRIDYDLHRYPFCLGMKGQDIFIDIIWPYLGPTN